MMDGFLPDNPLQPLYVLHGEEELLRLEAVDSLRRAAAEQGYLNRETHYVEADFDWQAFLLSAAGIGLFADLKLIELHLPAGRPGRAGGEALERFAARLPEDSVSVVVLPKLDKAQQQSKWFAALAAAGKVWEARPVGTEALPAWIRRRLAAVGLDIGADALSLFAMRVEGNLLAARQEVEKLALLYPQGHCLEAADVENSVADLARFDTFQVASAWMTGDTVRLLRLLDGLEAEGEEPVLLLWAVAEDIRTLIRLTAALKQGQSIGQVRNSLRLWGSRQQWAAAAVKRIGVGRLVAALRECAAADRMIKGAQSGNAWAHLRGILSDLSAV